MLVVLSPAKTLDYETPPHVEEATQPVMLDESEQLIERLRQLAPQDISALMKISDKLGNLNFSRYQDWHRPFTATNAKQAVLAFKGDVYTGLEAQSLTEQQLDWAQSRLRILSGLYGVLKPLDLMQPYRLEMGTRLDTQLGNAAAKDLYAFWGDRITEQLNQALPQSAPSQERKSQQGKPVLVNLASNEYFKSVQVNKIAAEVITPVFKDFKSGKYKIISFYAKKARGLMTRYIIENQIDDVEQIKAFDVAGYQYNPAMSDEGNWVFTRQES